MIKKKRNNWKNNTIFVRPLRFGSNLDRNVVHIVHKTFISQRQQMTTRRRKRVRPAIVDKWILQDVLLPFPSQPLWVFFSLQEIKKKVLRKCYIGTVQNIQKNVTDMEDTNSWSFSALQPRLGTTTLLLYNWRELLWNGQYFLWKK